MKTRKAGFLTEREKAYLGSGEFDFRENKRVRDKAKASLSDLIQICRKSEHQWVKQQYKIFRDAFLPSLDEENSLEKGDFIQVITCLVDVCFEASRRMARDKYLLDRNIHFLSDYTEPLISPEGYDMILGINPWFTEDPQWDEVTRTAMDILFIQVLTPIIERLKERDILLSCEAYSYGQSERDRLLLEIGRVEEE